MRKNRIFIIGAAILDVLVTPAEPEVFENGSYPAEEIRIAFGGDAQNEAFVLARLGKAVSLNAVVGKDAQGKMIRQRCRENNIELVEGQNNSDIQTGVNVVLVRQNGERNFLTNRNGSLRKLKLSDVQMPFPEDTGILCFASIFVFPHLTGKEMAVIFEQAKAQGITVCADMTKRKQQETIADLEEALVYVDYLFPNEEEACLISGVDSTEQAAYLLRRAGAKNVIIKCGKRGCYVLAQNADDGYYVPAQEAVCVDTTGAGDSFAAGFLYGLSEGWEMRKCAEFANSCGAKAVGYVGATTWCE
ncbi:MAG: sugar kinase [Lachnospiraceae bacterium]|nr:sugar kinase [Lachnospiraceae bacterium]